MPRGLLAIERVNAHAQRFACERHTRPGAIAPTTQTTSPTTPHCRRLLPRWFATWAALPRGVTSPPPNGGSCAARAPLHVLPADNVATKRGNCTIRGATRRRHADRTLLMLQTPPSTPGCGGVAEVNCVPESPASQNIWAITPMPAIVRRGGLHRGRHIPANRDLTTPNRDLTTPNRGLTTPNRGLTASKRGELHH